MVSLHHVAREWENDEIVREQMRTFKNIVYWDNPEETKINVLNASMNYEVLKPLCRRLLDPATGVVGMHSIPQIQTQLLDKY